VSASSELQTAATRERDDWTRSRFHDQRAIHLALADWLEAHIADHSSYDCDTDGPCAGVRVARAINGVA
jgi:hypothetical protein